MDFGRTAPYKSGLGGRSVGMPAATEKRRADTGFLRRIGRSATGGRQ